MIPYATFSYFGVLLYVVLPAVLLGMMFGRMRLWILGATLLQLWLRRVELSAETP